MTRSDTVMEGHAQIIPDVSKETMLNYLASIAREVDVLRALSGSLSVTYLLDVFEDERDVHIVMEYCCGAELKGKLEATERVESTVRPHLYPEETL